MLVELDLSSVVLGGMPIALLGLHEPASLSRR